MEGIQKCELVTLDSAVESVFKRRKKVLSQGLIFSMVLFYLQKLATPRQRFLTRLIAFSASPNGGTPHIHTLYSFQCLKKILRG